MKLTIIGSASAEPNPGSASSCYLLDAGRGRLVLECGHGAAAKLLLYTTIEDIGAVLISHMHPDHFFDLVPLKYLLIAGHRRMPLYVPPTGPAILAGIASGLGEKEDFWTKAYDIHIFDPGPGLQLLGMSIAMSPTRHFIPAWSMRFVDQESGGVLGYTSDTAFSNGVVGHLANSDLLLAEASVEFQTRPEHDQGHLTGEQAGELAKQARARHLVLTHYPYCRASTIHRAACSVFTGTCDLAVEGATYKI